MLRPRIIPCLLLHQGGVVKTVKFKNPKYIGDPINTVKIFNEKEVDELIILDIDATVNGDAPDYKMIANLAAECRMPLCYGGGIKTVEHAKAIIGLGVEKVAISSAAVQDLNLIRDLAAEIGRQSVAVVLDVKRNFLGNDYDVVTHNGLRSIRRTLWDLADEIQSAGAGEIIVNSVGLDGVMSGYDLDMAKRLRMLLNIPITIIGGAGKLEDIGSLFKACGIVGAAAGSIFVFKGAYKAVLISYPNVVQREQFDLFCY
jgi:imidazole glycerol-phosphate synthase subunit HisF